LKENRRKHVHWRVRSLTLKLSWPLLLLDMTGAYEIRG
jgi:hypothetical protein